MKLVIVSILLSIFSVAAIGDEWTPDPKFSIEGSTYIETLTFISGVAYGLTYASKELKRQGKSNFYCYSKESVISSKLLIDLTNKELSGDYTSEQILSTITAQLKSEYPCTSQAGWDIDSRGAVRTENLYALVVIGGLRRYASNPPYVAAQVRRQSVG